MFVVLTPPLTHRFYSFTLNIPPIQIRGNILRQMLLTFSSPGKQWNAVVF